jgi:coenzyme F420-0:L-glutamate ligase/coenzyme F420-1:gamma-L-glutamate ligase
VRTANEVRLIPVYFADEILAGDDLAQKLASELRHQKLYLQKNDVVVVKHKIISKAEGQIVALNDVRPRRSALAWRHKYGGDARVLELAMREAKRIVRRKNGVLITETRHGFVCANSGVDASNVDGGRSAVLLPRDPDRSAARLRAGIKQLFGVTVAVIVSDSFGRPWREGLVFVAIGVAGLKPIADFRGICDSHDYTLRGTVEAVADELACAAGLVCGKLNRAPVCVIRGFKYVSGKGSARELVRRKNDLFR